MKDDAMQIEFDKMSARERNKVIHAVNIGMSKEKAGLTKDVEKWYYDRLIEYGNEVKRDTGRFPEFEYQELDYDNPSLDIYND